MDIVKSIYDVSQNQKKQICLKVSLPYGQKYLSNLVVISENTPEKIEEIPEMVSNYQAVSEKLYCYSCNVNFNDYHEMRKHQWTNSHREKRGLSTVSSEINSDEDDSDEIATPYNEQLFEEEVEVDNEKDDNEDDSFDDKDDEKVNSGNDVDENKLDGSYNNVDYIKALKSGKVTFNEVCSFPTVYFQNTNNEIIGIKRCMLFNKKERPDNRSELMSCVNKLVECKKFAVFLYSGGCFAGAIFEGNKQIVHKTIKRYTYRRQQGGSQTTKDNQGHACKSGGAYLRRVNTQKLLEDVFQLLHVTWAEEISKCGLILVWSAKSQRHIFGHESMLNQARQKLSFNVTKDSRVRFISARISKVNNSTLLEVYREVSTIEVYDSDTISNFIQKTVVKVEPKKEPIIVETKPKKPKSKRKSPVKKDNSSKTTGNVSNEETDDEIVEKVFNLNPPTKEEDEIRTKLLNYVLNDSAEDLVPYLNDLKLSKSYDEISSLLSAPMKTKNQSFLHLAITHNNDNVITHLLESGCDPLHRNCDGETPYAQAIRQRNKSACTVMSDFMFKNPEQYDYHMAKFPGGKDPLKELQRKKQQAEKKKVYKKERKQKLKLEEEERKKEAIKKCEADQFLSLDNVSKRIYLKQVERDQRKRFLLCFQCATNISDIVPFSYCDFTFCGMDCLKKHRLANEK